MRHNGFYGFMTGAIAVLCLLAAGCTKEDRADAEVPETVKAFCLQWFPNERIVSAAEADGGIWVTLCGGTTAAFDASGSWTRIENRERALPRGIVSGPIEEYLAAHYPDSRILLLEHRKGYRVGLDSEVVLTFNEDFQVTVQAWEDVDVIPIF